MNPAQPTLIDRLRSRGEPALFYTGAALIAVVCLVAYLPALNGGFIWDDDVSLYNNPLILDPYGLRSIWFSTKPFDYFPLTYSSFWFEWRLWEGDPLGYRTINVLLHGGGAVLFWRVLREMKIPGSWWAGILFALHPVCVASVAWITERKNTLSLLFCLLSLLWYLRFVERDQWRLYAASLGAFLLALLSKSSVAMLPVALVAWHWWRQLQPKAPTSWRKLGLSLAPFFGISLIFGLVTIWFQTHRAIGVEHIPLDPLLKRVLAGTWSTWLYLNKIVWPANLSMVYPRLEINSRTWWNYLPAAAWLVLAGVGYCFRKSWGKHLCFAEVCFLASLLPVLGLFPMYYFTYSQRADHWQYLALIPVVGASVGGVFHATRRFELHGILTPASVTAAILAVALGTLTWRQSSVYKSSRTLWEDVIRKNPTTWVAYNNLAAQLPDPRAAEACYRKALSLDPDSALILNNLGVSIASQERPGEAIAFFERALNLEPQYGEAHSNLGSVLLRLNRVDEALPHLETGLRLCPHSAVAHSDLADAKGKLGQWAAAIELYRAALQLKPGMPGALFGLGRVLFRTSRPVEAVSYLEAAVEAQPKLVDARVVLGAALLELGETNNAIQWFESALRLDPTKRDALEYLRRVQSHDEKVREHESPPGAKR